MKLWSYITNAVIGWIMITRNEQGWRERFVISAPGLITALCIFAFVAFLAIAFGSMSYGMPSPFGVATGMFVLALPIIALVVTLLSTRTMLKSQQPALPILVPGVYALTAFILFEGFLAMVGGPVVMLAWLGLGYLLFRLVRAVTDWGMGVAVGFAVLTVVLLVMMRLALYMQSNPAGSPI